VKNIRECAEEYWDNVAGDSEVGVSCKQLVIEAYISGAFSISATIAKTFSDWYKDSFGKEID
jgi:hypothetical protein